MNGWDWFWTGAIWNEMEAARDDSQEEARECQQIEIVGSCGRKDEDIMKIPVERKIEIEQQLKLVLHGMTANVTNEYGPTVTIRGEVRATGGTLEREVEVVAAVYNANDEVIGVASCFVDAKGFIGAEPIEVEVICSDSHGEPAQVKIYVKQS